MIETYKILTGRYDNHAGPALQLSAEGNSGGNMLKVMVNRTKNNLRKYLFANRIVSVCNSLPNLPNHVITTTSFNSLNQFKARLDKFWVNQTYGIRLTGTKNKIIKIFIYTVKILSKLQHDVGI